jgi:hypothetical protein
MNYTSNAIEKYTRMFLYTTQEVGIYEARQLG